MWSPRLPDALTPQQPCLQDAAQTGLQGLRGSAPEMQRTLAWPRPAPGAPSPCQYLLYYNYHVWLLITVP